MRLRILTYNVHKCIGGVDRRYDPVRIITVIARYEPDLVLLQEVDQHAQRTNTDRQVDLLGDALGYRHRSYFPNVKLRTGGEYGNAILSRFPLTETSNIDLTIPPKKRRSVLHARYRIRINGARHTRTLHVYNLHLGLSGLERKLQLRRFLESHPFVGLHHRTPILVAGDFNDIWGTIGRKLLEPAGFRDFGGRPIKTFPAWGPLRALDSAYIRGDAKIVSAYRARVRLARRASDHLPLVVDFEIE